MKHNRRIWAVAAALALSFAAQATEQQPVQLKSSTYNQGGTGIGVGLGQGGDAKAVANNVVNVGNDQADRYPVATAFAVPLTAANGTCMGSTSAGAQGVTIGLSLGSTWTSDQCNRRYNSVRMQELGQTKAAIALMCQDVDVKAAMEEAGTPCPTKPAKTTQAGAQKPWLTDPLVRQRDGLAPL